MALRTLPSLGFLFHILLAGGVRAQGNTQTIRGTILDSDTRQPLIGATVVIVGSSPIKGSTTDLGELEKKALQAAQRQALWLGTGFPWTDIEASKLHTLISLGVVRTLGKAAQQTEGAYWVRGPRGSRRRTRGPAARSRWWRRRRR